jgi:hypothetical protein
MPGRAVSSGDVDAALAAAGGAVLAAATGMAAGFEQFVSRIDAAMAHAVAGADLSMSIFWLPLIVGPTDFAINFG